MPQRLLSVLVTSTLLASVPGSEAAADPTRSVSLREISLELIMSDPDWIGNAPENPYWADDSRSVYFEQKRQGGDHRDLVHLGLDGETSVVEDAKRGSVSVEGGAWSLDRSRKVYSRAGDLYLRDVATGKVRQLTRTVEGESAPYFLADENRVAFLRRGEVFVRELDSGLEYQPADIRLEDDPAEKDEASDYLSRQQPRLITWVREQEEKKATARERRLAERRADATRVPEPWYLGTKVEVQQRHLSPSDDWMVLVLAEKENDPGRADRMPNYVSSDGYVAVEDVRPKVGTHKRAGDRLVLLDLARHTSHEIDISTLPGITEDPLAELRQQAKQRREKEAGQAEQGSGEQDDAEQDDAEQDDAEDPRAVHFFDGIRFSRDGERLAVMARSLDNKDRWIFLLERPTDEEPPSPKPVHRLYDEAWINWNYNEFGWLDDEGRQLYFLSEETGWSQLYLYSTSEAAVRRLTDGNFVVREPQISPDRRFIYYTANPDHPGIYEIFRVDAATARAEQLTRLGGLNSARLSPDGRQLLITHSTTTRPPELYLQPAGPSRKARRMTHTVSDAFTRLAWVEPEIVEVASSHQERPVYSRFYPTSSDATRGEDGKRAAVIFVHGAGYLQNAHHGWSNYFREFMFHTWLNRNGYVVLDMDYRASEGYGRDWRTAIYRHMGSVEVEDMADGVDWLVTHHGVDPKRVGVYGGSYGGFVTFMSLFKEPELFACGAALRPVTDWAHYNHPYTANILNEPEVDPEAYERSSPIEFAEGLEKPLLICAGMQDDNVFFQDTVRLAQVLIELGKEDWEVAIYPIEPHGFREPSSWLDEYRRIFKLFQRHLRPSPYP